VRTLLVVLCGLLLASCGAEDAERLTDDARASVERTRDRAAGLVDQAEQVGERARELRERLRKRAKRILEDIRKAVPEATTATRAPQRGDRALQSYANSVLQDVDRYWERTLAAADRPQPQVGFVWIPPGGSVCTGCGARAGDDAALYCPADDTIYLAERFAAAVIRGGGDFGMAYVIAHEYAHNVQQELGIFEQGRRLAVKPFELQADCFAGAWGNSVYKAGRLKPGDVEEALRTAKAVGDFEYLDPQHHGTPTERRDAWLLGYHTGSPARCSQYLPRT